MRRLRPLSPAVALTRLLRESAEDMARKRQREARLAEVFAPLLSLDEPAATWPTPQVLAC